MGGLRPNDEKNVGVRRQTPLGRPKAAKNRPAQRAASNPAGNRNPLCRFGVHLADFSLMELLKWNSGGNMPPLPAP